MRDDQEPARVLLEQIPSPHLNRSHSLSGRKGVDVCVVDTCTELLMANSTIGKKSVHSVKDWAYLEVSLRGRVGRFPSDHLSFDGQMLTWIGASRVIGARIAKIPPWTADLGLRLVHGVDRGVERPCQ